MEKMKVKIQVDKISAYDLDGKLIDTIANLASYLEKVPDEFQDSCMVDVDCYDHYQCPSCEIEIYYYRDETDEEFLDRKALHENREKVELEKKRKLLKQLKEELGEE